LQDGLLLDTETFYTIAQQEILAGLGKVGSSSTSSATSYNGRLYGWRKTDVSHVSATTTGMHGFEMPQGIEVKEEMAPTCIAL
jgi:hypothetical protein